MVLSPESASIKASKTGSTCSTRPYTKSIPACNCSSTVGYGRLAHETGSSPTLDCSARDVSGVSALSHRESVQAPRAETDTPRDRKRREAQGQKTQRLTPS